jgi:hypothetical protein
MERFAGAISSPPEDAFDLDRVWRAGLSSSPSRVGGRSLSESDVIAVDVDATDIDRRDALVSVVVFAEVLLVRFPFAMLPEVLAGRTVCAPVFLRRERVSVRDKWYTGANREKRPSSGVWKHATTHCPV